MINDARYLWLIRVRAEDLFSRHVWWTGNGARKNVIRCPLVECSAIAPAMINLIYAALAKTLESDNYTL